jgi:hypothetical protein
MNRPGHHRKLGKTMSSRLLYVSYERIRRIGREMNYAGRRVVELQAPWIR